MSTFTDEQVETLPVHLLPTSKLIEAIGEAQLQRFHHDVTLATVRALGAYSEAEMAENEARVKRFERLAERCSAVLNNRVPRP